MSRNHRRAMASFRRKIEEIGAFREDAMIEKIIRAFQKQIAQDFYRLSLLE